MGSFCFSAVGEACLAEVGATKKFLEKDDLGSLGCSFTDQLLAITNINPDILVTAEQGEGHPVRGPTPAFFEISLYDDMMVKATFPRLTRQPSEWQRQSHSGAWWVVLSLLDRG